MRKFNIRTNIIQSPAMHLIAQTDGLLGRTEILPLEDIKPARIVWQHALPARINDHLAPRAHSFISQRERSANKRNSLRAHTALPLELSCPTGPCSHPSTMLGVIFSSPSAGFTRSFSLESWTWGESSPQHRTHCTITSRGWPVCAALAPMVRASPTSGAVFSFPCRDKDAVGVSRFREGRG